MTDKNIEVTDLYETKVYYTKGRFNEELYNEYIKQHLTTKSNDMINTILNSNEIEDRYINYISIGLKSDRPCSYSELLLLELDNNDSTYIPAIISNINTSSPYALMRTYTDDEDDENNEDDENDENENENDNEDKNNDKCKMNLYDLKKLIMKNYDSTKIINYVLEKYV